MMIKDKTEFQEKLTKLINNYSLEGESNTPDFILAQYLVDCLATFNAATHSREDWYRPIDFSIKSKDS